MWSVYTTLASAGTIEAGYTGCDGVNPNQFNSLTLPSGGNSANYSYTWQNSTNACSGGGTWTTISGATATVYDPPLAINVTTCYRRCVTDGCTTICTPASTITVVPDPTSTATPTTPTTICAGGTVSMTATSANGTGTCTLTWQSSPNGSSGWANISGATGNNYTTPVLTAGTYYYRSLYDCTGLGCNQGPSATITVTVNALPTVTASSNSPICSGNNLNLTSSGGTTYSWSGPNGFSSAQQNPTITAATTAATGTYTVTVTNANNCTATAQTNVTVNLTPTVTTSTTNVSCFGGTNGTATANPSGGTTFTYNWNTSPAQTTQTATNLAAGTYTVTVTNNNNCTATIQATITQPTLLNASLTNTVNVSCNGGNNGQLDVTVSGGTPGYTYLWSNNATSQDIGALMAGTYSVTITDANNCTAVLTANVTQPAVLAITPTANPTNICTGGSSALNVTSMGGTGTVNYVWNNGLGSGASHTVSPTSTTTYTVTATDANSCTASGQVTVTVAADPTISTQPTNQTVCVDAVVNLTVAATGGTGSFTYQWQSATSCGGTFANISGATSSTYTPPTATLGITAYRAIVTNSGSGCDALTSNCATVSVVGQASIGVNISSGP